MKTNEIPDIAVKGKWSTDSVRTLCIREGYYTKGFVDGYNTMLNTVQFNRPTVEAIYRVALDIYEHSDRDIADVANIMHQITRDAVDVFYEIG